jgi:ribosomal protein L17
MRHNRNRYQLSRSASHRKSLLMNLSKEVIEHERITTSETKAKAVKPELEKLITLGSAAICTPAGRRCRRSARTSSRCTSCSRR